MWVSLAGPPGLAVHLVEHQHCKVPGLWCGGSQDRGVRHHILRFAKDVNPKAVQTWTWHARPSRKSISTWTSNIYIYIYRYIHYIFALYITYIYLYIYIQVGIFKSTDFRSQRIPPVPRWRRASACADAASRCSSCNATSQRRAKAAQRVAAFQSAALGGSIQYLWNLHHIRYNGITYIITYIIILCWSIYVFICVCA